ncbi:MAG TPA: hypothetical protein ENH37_13805 [Deltaproteobacteria bacterium]|nr:hypothetical protein [Deltaproteobacteria bacterium]
MPPYSACQDADLHGKLTGRFKRTLQNRLPETSFFLFGPRQAGKTTLLNDQKPHLIIDLLDPELQLSYNKTPNLLRQQIDDLPPGRGYRILTDEIQRVPRLLDIVHALMEKRPDLQFIMCGSSARNLRRGASNLLGGRALYGTTHPLLLTRNQTPPPEDTLLGPLDDPGPHRIVP